MPRSGCSALHGVNSNQKKKEKRIEGQKVALESRRLRVIVQ